MSDNNLGRVQGGGFYGSTSTSTTSIQKTTVQTNGNISPLVGDIIVNANGDLLKITAITSTAYTVTKYGSIKGAQGAPGSGGTTYTLPEATATTLGGIKLGSNTTQNTSVNSPSSMAGRTYPVQKNAQGQAVVNVPWTDEAGGGSGGGGGGVEYTILHMILGQDEYDITGCVDVVLFGGDTVAYTLLDYIESDDDFFNSLQDMARLGVDVSSVHPSPEHDFGPSFSSSDSYNPAWGIINGTPIFGLIQGEGWITADGVQKFEDQKMFNAVFIK